MNVRTLAALGVLAAFAIIGQSRPHSQAPAFDLVIRNGRIVDGTGNPWFLADVGIKGDSIAAIAPHLNAGGAAIVDASG
mgnify:FL=1